MSIGEQLPAQLLFWCHWNSENVPKKCETQMTPVPNVSYVCVAYRLPSRHTLTVWVVGLCSSIHHAAAHLVYLPSRQSLTVSVWVSLCSIWAVIQASVDSMGRGLMFQRPPCCSPTCMFASTKYLWSLPSKQAALPLQHHSQHSTTKSHPPDATPVQAASGAHPVSGGHAVAGGHPASGDCQVQAGSKPATVPAPFSVPRQLPQSFQGVLQQPAALAAATHPEASPDAKGSTPTAAAQTFSKLWSDAWKSNVESKRLATVGSRTMGESRAPADSVPEAAATTCEMRMGIRVNTITSGADVEPRGLSPTGPSASRLARGKNFEPKDLSPTRPSASRLTQGADFKPRDLSHAERSAIWLACRAAQSQRPPQSPPTTTAPAASNSPPARNSLPINAQQQRSQSLPSSQQPQQSSLGAAASPGSGLLVTGNLNGQALAAKGRIDGQSAPAKGNADGQASGSAAAPVGSKAEKHSMPVRGNAGEQTSGQASAAAATTDQTRALGSASVSPRALTVALSSALPAEDAEAVGQDYNMNCGATSPTVLTWAVPKTQRRQLLQLDSRKRRQQTCMACLTAARHDTLRWLRTQRKVSMPAGCCPKLL